MTDVHVATEQLSAYVDGALGEAEAARVTDHLAGCSECRGHVEELRELDMLAQTLPREMEPPSDIAKRVRARLEPRRAAVTPWWWAAAAALVLAFVPWILFREQNVARMGARTASEETAPAPESRKGDTAGQNSYAGAPPESKLQPKVQPQEKPAAPTSLPPTAALDGKKRFVEPPPADKEARLKDGERDERGRLDELPSKDVVESVDVTTQATTGQDAASPGAAAPKQAPPPEEGARRAQSAPSGGAKTESGGAAQNEGYSAIASDEDIASYRWLRTTRIRNGDDARRVRDEWLRVFARAGGRPHGEAALMAAIESAAAAYHFDHRPADLLALRNLTATYLTRPHPSAGDHVRELLAKAEAEKAP